MIKTVKLKLVFSKGGKVVIWMMVESYSEEKLLTLELDLRKLFMAGGTISYTPKERYDHANMVIENAEKCLEVKGDHPALKELFAKLEASLEKAQSRRSIFEERNKNLK